MKIESNQKKCNLFSFLIGDLLKKHNNKHASCFEFQFFFQTLGIRLAEYDTIF